MHLKRTLQSIAAILIIAFIGMCFYYVIWFITDEEFRTVFWKDFSLDSWQTLVDYGASVIFTTCATLFYWHKRERDERERALLRLQVLDNQLSPHFVFNHFSILASLIEVNPKKASEFLMNLSKVYRYALTHQEHATVSLLEERIFLAQYVELLNERFGDAIQIKISPELQTIEAQVPPCVLQMLIENAIKHNEHTAAHPLIIDVTVRNSQICISNPKRPIESMNSANIGQHNIEERYRLLSRKKITIEETEESYTVLLPLIEKKS